MPPLFSVVVPTYCRPRALALCLEALSRLEEPRGGFEVVVVDDGSPVPVDKVVEPFMRRMSLTCLRQANAGPAAARNRGVREARAPFIAFADDDCSPEPGWLGAFARQFEHHPERLLGGRTFNGVPSNILSQASQNLLDYLAERSGKADEVPRFFPSNNMAVARSGLDRLGGFDEAFALPAAEDRDLCHRWRQRGWPMSRVEHAVVYHLQEHSLRSFWRQHESYGRGAACLRRKHAAGAHGPLEPKAPSFFLGMLLHPARSGEPRRALPIALLMALSQIATARGFAAEMLQRRPPLAALPDTRESATSRLS